MFNLEQLLDKSLVELRELAKEYKIESASKLKKSELADAILAASSEKVDDDYDEEVKETKGKKLSEEERTGTLEILPDGFGFLRKNIWEIGDDDVYVPASQIKRFNLRTGDIVKGLIRAARPGEKFEALIYVKEINGLSVDAFFKAKRFEDLKPVFPDEKFDLDIEGETSLRMIDIFSPIGKGQRGLIVAPPKAGKTTLLKSIANGILKNNKDVYMYILLIDERPEEVTDMERSVVGNNVEVVASTFDETPENHSRITEMILARAERQVEKGKDVVIILDSITRLGRAYNILTPGSGRTLSGGMDPTALHMPKKFFGAARNTEDGGSLTVIASALVETGSKMDEVIFEEFKGTGNMELVLDRRLADKRIYPAINVLSSGTRREDLLLSKDMIETTFELRKILASSALDSVNDIIKYVKNTKNNKELVKELQKITKVKK